MPYSHKDAAQALRVLKWIRFMESLKPTTLSKSVIVLVASMTAAEMSIVPELDAEAWKVAKVVHYKLKEEYEQGWPGACNFMFAEALKRIGDDAFLLEPDAIPLYPNWWDAIGEAWAQREQGQEFMGAYEPVDIPHMTGIGVYGRNWRKVAPKIATIQNARGWDTYAADQILPNAKITPLIQHIWRNPRLDNLSILSPDAVVFHQDKSGALISLLDREYYGCAAERETGYSAVPNSTKVMTRYFFNHNISKAARSNGLEFRFEPVGQVGSVWCGVFSTNDENEALALEALTRKSKSIIEISQAEFEAKLEDKKKVRPSRRSTVLDRPAMPAVQITQRPALLVDDPANSPIPVGERAVAGSAGPRVDNVDEVLKVGKVVPPETNRPTRSKKGK